MKINVRLPAFMRRNATWFALMVGLGTAAVCWWQLPPAVSQKGQTPDEATNEVRLAGVHNVRLTDIRDPQRLRELSLCSCSVERQSWVALPCFSNLEELCLDGCRVTDEELIDLPKLKRLKVLSLLSARIGNKTAAHFKQLTNLKYLCLHGTNISRSGLESLSALKGLESLDLSRLTASKGLRHIAGLTNLQELLAIDCQLYPEDMASISGLTKLRKLNLSCNKDITSEDFNQLVKLTDLEELDLSMMLLGDKIEPFLSKLKKLKVLWLDHTAITDKTCKTLGSLSNIEELSLTATGISNEGMFSIAKLDKLKGVVRPWRWTSNILILDLARRQFDAPW
jgi:Leucine-rich repeat (LRR) protein